MCKLRDLLAANSWKEADTETANLISELSEKNDLDGSWCNEVREIDRLWVEYSNHRFGFSVQNELYNFFGAKRDYDKVAWERFGDSVGWRVEKKWIAQYCIFDLTAPHGHLPVMGTWTESNDDYPSDKWHGWSLGTSGWYSDATGWHREDISDLQHSNFTYFMSKITSCTNL